MVMEIVTSEQYHTFHRSIWWRFKAILEERKWGSLHERKRNEKQWKMGNRNRNSGHSKDYEMRCFHLYKWSLAEVCIQAWTVMGCIFHWQYRWNTLQSCAQTLICHEFLADISTILIAVPISALIFRLFTVQLKIWHLKKRVTLSTVLITVLIIELISDLFTVQLKNWSLKKKELHLVQY